MKDHLKEILDWFRGEKNYESGRLLYEKHGPSLMQKRVFGRGKNAMRQQQLEYHLDKILIAGGVNKMVELRDKKLAATPKSTPPKAKAAPKKKRSKSPKSSKS